MSKVKWFKITTDIFDDEKIKVIEKMPESIKKSANPLFEFNKAIIDATADFAASFKVNLAFYEAYGLAEQTMERNL